MTKTGTLAKISGTMLTPGVSRNNRLYTADAIGRTVERMRGRLADPAALPIVMRTHHAAGDNSRLIVGRLTDVVQQPDGSADYEAVLYDTQAGRDIGALIDPDKPALKSTSISGYWVGPVEKFRQGPDMVETGHDLEIDAIDFTGSPGVTGAQIRSVAYESATARPAGREPIVETGQATITLVAPPDSPPTDQRNPVIERYTPAQRTAMAARGQAMANGGYAIATKGDLRAWLRTVDETTPVDVREHISARASALGFSGMVPAGFLEAAQPGRHAAAPATPAVDETYVVVCVGDDTGPLVKVCAANVEPDDVMAAAKKAAKLAARILANGPDADTDAGMALQVGPDDGGQATAYDIGTDDETHQKEPTVAEKWTVTVGERELPTDQVAAIVAEATAAPAAPQTTPAPAGDEQKEVAVGDATKAVETTATAPTAPLTEADVKRLIKESGEKAARKAEKKAAKASTSSTDATTESTTKAGTSELQETITPAQLEAKLAEERARTREAVIAAYGLPSRRGHRYVAENDEPTGEDLWDKRGELFASAVPGLFAPAVPVNAPANAG